MHSGLIPDASRQRADLTHHAPVELGGAVAHPAQCRVDGANGSVTVEPRVMQVIVVLADAGGAVVSRDELLERCWHGVTVGDDSLNRAIAGARRALAKAGAAASIETIPRIGYRLMGAARDSAVGQAAVPRRGLIIGMGALAATAAGAGWLALRPARRDRAVEQLVQRGWQALRDDYPDSAEQGAGFLREAVARAPDDAEAWGLLALALRNIADYAPLDQIDSATAACQQAAARALSLEPDQPQALAALALLPPMHGDWLAAERRLRAVLARHPDQLDALSGLGLLMISVGRIADGTAAVARAAQLEPLSPIYQYRRAYHLWFGGDLAAADRTIDRALQLWPRHPAVWYAKVLIRGTTGREETVLHMLDNDEQAERIFSPPMRRQWQLTMEARLSGDPAIREAAIAASVEAVQRVLPASVNAVLLLSILGALDQAFAVTDAYLLSRGPLLSPAAAAAPFINDQRWRKTMMLFTPATAPLRADPRFAQLCADMGLAEYWRQSGSRPDHLQASLAA